jgi:hypothetical protein
MPGHPTTVSGQASAPPVRRSPRPWIALAAVVASAGVAAAVVSGRGPGAAIEPSAPRPAAMPMPPPAPAQPRLQGVLTPSGPTPVAPGQWFAFHALAMPGWDPKNIDVDAFLGWAIQVAKQTIADAELVRFDATGVYPDGHADLTLSRSGVLMVQFISPSRARRDPSMPVGAQPDWHCMFNVVATTDTGPFIAPANGSSCEDVRPQRVPRCNARGVWRQMIERKAPSGNAVAQIDYFAHDKATPAQWHGNITGAFGASFPDACP